MSLARRLLASTAISTGPTGAAGQVEFTLPGLGLVQVPTGVESMSGVAIAAGVPGGATSPFPGGRGGNLHWRNDIPVTPGEWLEVVIGSGARGAPTISGVSGGWTVVRRVSGGEVLLQARADSTVLDHLTLGGGGGLGGASGPGGPGNGGNGGGGPGYAGSGGRGGNYLDTYKGEFPETDSGGGRGGSSTGNPTGWVNSTGEGTGLLGRSADKTTSLGAKLFGAGAFATASNGLNGGARLIWGGRSYPDNAPDAAQSTPATFVAAVNGTGAGPFVINFPTGTVAGDMVMLFPVLGGGGGITGVTGSTHWQQTGACWFKQVTAADVTAAAANSISFNSSGTFSWITVTYRGPRMVLSRGSATDSTPSDTITLPGFTKRVDCQRVVTMAHDPDAAAVINTPAGFTSRAVRTTPRDMRVSDIAPADYVNGASVVYTGMSATTSGIAYLLELY